MILPDKSDLHHAAMRGDLPFARDLLAAGADVQQFAWGGITPLHCAASVEMAQLLLDAGADIDAHDHWCNGSSGSTPLLAATTMGLLEVAGLLLERGADPNISNMAGCTPLWAAAEQEAWNLVSRLLASGADPDLDAHYDLLPSLFVLACFGHMDLVRRLLPSATEADLVTGLANAVRSGHFLLTELLLHNGADVTGIGADTMTYAITAGQHDIVRLLIQHGADPTSIDHNGTSPLEASWDSGEYGIIETIKRAMLQKLTGSAELKSGSVAKLVDTLWDRDAALRRAAALLLDDCTSMDTTPLE